jgi:hypothetical protein
MNFLTLPRAAMNLNIINRIGIIPLIEDFDFLPQVFWEVKDP